ncbi:MAG: SpoIIE family protein phosphatase [Bacteroidaceae bacterium]|nr:SpoIIE family protein phosphatase [Bacteroidaceae bacterium]
MKEKLKRLYHSISFRLTMAILLVFLIAGYYSGRAMVFSLNMFSNAEDCIKTSEGVSEVINAKVLHIEDLLRFGVLADINGLSTDNVLKASQPLKETGFADSIYFAYRGKMREELSASLKKQQDAEKACWTEPYRRGDKVVVTVALRVGDYNRLLCADIQTQWIDSLMNNSKPSDNAKMYLVSPEGRFICHPDRSMVGEVSPEEMRSLNEDWDWDEASGEAVQVSQELEHDAVFRNKNGAVSATATSFGHEVPANDWYVRCNVPFGSDSGEFGLAILVIVMSLFSLTFIVILLIVVFMTRRSLYPLAKIADATLEIAKGNFQAPLPKVKPNNEIRMLRNNFEQMQHELADYMENLKNTTEQKVSMERDLQIAHDIQQGLLPQTFPAFPERNDLDIYGIQIPARTVGGDLFDFFMRDNKLFFCIGDVSGKGVPAALFMAIACRLFRHAGRKTTDPVEIVSAINDELSHGNERNMFCTLLAGVLDMESGELQLCNAGHNAPVFIRKGQCKYLELKVNIPAGVFENFVYQGESMILEPGDSLFLYTDGVTEAENTAKELYGDDATLATVTSHSDEDMQSLAETVLTSVHAFANGAEQSDDLTMLCLKYRP